MSSWHLMLCGLFAVVSTGCEPVSRVRQCRHFSSLINAAHDEAEARAKPFTPAGYRAAAARYQKLALDLQSVRIVQPAGKALRDEYLNFVKSSAPAVTVYAEALESKDQRRIEDARRPLQRLQHQARSLASRYSAFCHGH